MTHFRSSPLVLLHGFPLNFHMWDSVNRSLAEHYQVFTLDLPGFGKRPTTQVDSIAAWAEDVHEQLHELGIEQPIQLCGLSMGGYVAMEFAAKFSDRLSRLILCDTKSEADQPEARQNRLKIAEQLGSEDYEIQQAAMRKLEVDMPQLLLSNQVKDFEVVVSKVVAMIRQNSPRALANAQLAMADRRDTTEAITDLVCPILAIVGVDDRLTTPASMQSLVSHCQQGTLKEIPFSGHLPPIENPDAFVAAIV